MNGEYKVYKRDTKGLLGDLITDFTAGADAEVGRGVEVDA